MQPLGVTCSEALYILPFEFVHELMDGNFSLTRSVDVAGDKNLWKRVMPTVTGSGLYIVRAGILKERCDNVGTAAEQDPLVVARQVDGLELLNIIGFDTSYFASPYVPGQKLATSWAGNAFSGYAVGPVFMAALSAPMPSEFAPGPGAQDTPSARDTPGAQVNSE